MGNKLSSAMKNHIKRTKLLSDMCKHVCLNKVPKNVKCTVLISYCCHIDANCLVNANLC